jgi:hypothetical protein
MPKLKREMFARAVRMTHRFGDKDDPFQKSEYFDAPYPDGIKSVNQNGKGRYTGKEKGLAVFTEPYSGVDKARGGRASLSGPRPDVPDAVAETAPTSTKMRRTQGPNIKGKKED